MRANLRHDTSDQSPVCRLKPVPIHGLFTGQIGGSKMTRILLTSFALFAVVLQVQPAQALPINSSNWSQPQQFIMGGTFPTDGVVKMSNCSASLVKFKGVADTSQAIVLTNGHCVGGKAFGETFLKPNEIHNKTQRSFRMGLLNQEGAQILSILATEIIYATMTKTDLALLKLDKTYAELRALVPGVEPLIISDVHPKASLSIQIPSGYWKRTYACAIEKFVPTLKEAGYIWTDSIRYSDVGCDTIGGTSGSPILSADTGEIIGINNTGNEDGKACTMNNPCEEDSNGVQTVSHGASYGQQTFILYACLDSNNQFDLSTPGCSLPRGQKKDQ